MEPKEWRVEVQLKTWKSVVEAEQRLTEAEPERQWSLEES